MPDIIQQIRDTYATDKAAALNMLPELFRQYDEGKVIGLPCQVGDTVYEIGWTCSNGMKYNCESNGVMIGPNCYTCLIKRCDLHPVVVEEEVKSLLRLLSEYCYGDFGKTVFLTRKAAEAALKEVQN